VSAFDAILPVIADKALVLRASNGQQVKRQDAISHQEHIKPDAVGVGLDAFYGYTRGLTYHDQHTSSSRHSALFDV